MEVAEVRFEQEQKQWQDWVIRAKSKYGDQIIDSVPFLKDHLKQLEDIEIRYGSTANMQERRELNILRAKRREIEKRLYPGLLNRLAYGVLKSIVISKARKNFVFIKDSNFESLSVLLAKKGFYDMERLLSTHLNMGQSVFKIPVTFQINENSEMKYELQFCKGHNDKYELKDIKATLRSDGKTNGPSLLFSSISAGDLNTKQAFNLLSGRSIEKKEGWIILDSNDRDAEGNMRSKIFNSSYGFDVEKLVDQARIRGIDDLVERNRVLQSLRDGDQVQVQVGKELKMLEANPLHNVLEKPSLIMEKREHEARLQNEANIKKVVSKEAKTFKARIA